jgi:hypothetical protein
MRCRHRANLPPTMNPIDLDLEAIQLDGSWQTRDQLVNLIKSKLDAKDYCVSKPSEALAELTSTLSELRSVSLRVTPQLASAVAEAATRLGKSEASIIREALMMHFGLTDTVSAPAATTAPAQAPMGITGRANKPINGAFRLHGG